MKKLLETFESFICPTCNQQTMLKKIGILGSRERWNPELSVLIFNVYIYRCNHCQFPYKLIDKIPEKLHWLDSIEYLDASRTAAYHEQK